MVEPTAEEDEIARSIVDSAILVHKELGPGLLESVYETCLEDVLTQRRFVVERQKIYSCRFSKEKVGSRV